VNVSKGVWVTAANPESYSLHEIRGIVIVPLNHNHRLVQAD